MIKHRYNNLVKIIYNDLLIYNQKQLFLLLLIIISSILVIWITYQTRCMRIEREEFLLKKFSLESEWNNLVYEKSVLCNHARIEQIALNKLHMHYLDPVLLDI